VRLPEPLRNAGADGAGEAAAVDISIAKDGVAETELPAFLTDDGDDRGQGEDGLADEIDPDRYPSIQAPMAAE
jgi:hypothetical protein